MVYKFNIPKIRVVEVLPPESDEGEIAAGALVPAPVTPPGKKKKAERIESETHKAAFAFYLGLGEDRT